MKIAPAALPLIAALAISAVGASAANKEIREVTLDIDNDGRMDRAVLVREPSNASADLAIYLAAGDEKLDPARKPDILKKDIANAIIVAFENNGKGSLILTYGCGGCSNDYATTLTIVHRRGTFWIGGYRYDWETRDSRGSCDINFLTGKGVAQRDLGKNRPVAGKFAPVKLADWSDEKRPKTKACTA